MARNVVYIEDTEGRVYFFDYDPDTGAVRARRHGSGWESFNKARLRLLTQVRAEGASIRLPVSTTSLVDGTTYSSYRCSGCHRPIHSVRTHKRGLRPQNTPARRFRDLQDPFLPLDPSAFAGIDTECW